MIIDATNLIVGRVASIAAKKALLGENIFIVNAEQAVISGNKKDIFEKYKAQANRGEPFHGPFLPKTPDRLMKRVIRGMLPYKQYKGRVAFKRIKCYIGMPDEFKEKNLDTLEIVSVSKMQNLKYVTLGNLCQYLKKR